MNTEILGVILIFLLSIAMAWPLGKYMVKVFRGGVATFNARQI